MKQIILQKIARIRGWINHHRTASLIITSVIGIAVVGNVVMALLGQPLPKLIQDIVVKPRPVVYYSPLTGEKVKNQAAAKKIITAVVIENSPDARPQSGLKEGEVVYEAIAEGGITRFLVLYQQHNPKIIGPVRSLRHYHLDVAKPYQPSFAHVGGSGAALKKIRKGSGWRDLEQMYNGNYYWRSSDRYAPHNVYTSAKKLAALNKKKKYRTSQATGFSRDDAKPSGERNANRVKIRISSDDYNSSYRYVPSKRHYVRSQAGAVHKDRERGAIATKVIVALRVKEKTVFQDTYRQVITTTGSGKAVIFQYGHAYKVTWKRTVTSKQLRFYRADGSEFKLARGITWVSLVPRDKGAVSWK